MKCRIVFPFIFIQMGVHKLNEKERKKTVSIFADIFESFFLFFKDKNWRVTLELSIEAWNRKKKFKIKWRKAWGEHFSRR